MSTLPATPLEAAQDAYAVAQANLRLAEGAASRRGSGRMTKGERDQAAIMTRAVVKAAAQVVRCGGADPLDISFEQMQAEVRAERAAREAKVLADYKARNGL